jgi:hypothetical protein
VKRWMNRWNDTAFGASCWRTTPNFHMSKFCPTVTGLGPWPLEAAVKRLLRHRVPTCKPPLAQRRRGAHNNGGEWPLHRGTEVGHERSQVRPWGLEGRCMRHRRPKAESGPTV